MTCDAKVQFSAGMTIGGACLLEPVAILTIKIFLQKSFYIKAG